MSHTEGGSLPTDLRDLQIFLRSRIGNAGKATIAKVARPGRLPSGVIWLPPRPFPA